jgi:hypothetical protein
MTDRIRQHKLQRKRWPNILRVDVDLPSRGVKGLLEGDLKALLLGSRSVAAFVIVCGAK